MFTWQLIVADKRSMKVARCRRLLLLLLQLERRNSHRDVAAADAADGRYESWPIICRNNYRNYLFCWPRIKLKFKLHSMAATRLPNTCAHNSPSAWESATHKNLNRNCFMFAGIYRTQKSDITRPHTADDRGTKAEPLLSEQ